MRRRVEEVAAEGKAGQSWAKLGKAGRSWAKLGRGAVILLLPVQIASGSSAFREHKG